jgi:murein DD-endopeptidase MepM/ murein hydrolase activator NlpD
LTGDVNGDGRADIVGFGASNVFVSSGNSNGTFGTPIAYSPGLTKNVGDWTDNNNYPRVAGDVNNDGKADLIGFGASDVFASLAGAVTPPPLDYYPELSSLSETQWDRQSGDNNQFEQYPYGGGGDQRGKTDDRIEQIYTDLSKAIFGSRIPMTAGYAYDQSYYNGVVIKGTTGWWHAGLDIGANNEATIKAPIGGTVKWTSGSGDGNIFVGINSDDGRQWVYGHLKSKDGLSLGKRINTGETVGIVGALNHLHLEVENGLAYGNTDGAMKNQETLLSVTVSPLMAYWKWRNQ